MLLRMSEVMGFNSYKEQDNLKFNICNEEEKTSSRQELVVQVALFTARDSGALRL